MFKDLNMIFDANFDFIYCHFLANRIYRPTAVKDVAATEAEAEADYQSLLNTDKFRPEKGFSGAEANRGHVSG